MMDTDSDTLGYGDMSQYNKRDAGLGMLGDQL